MKDLIKKEQNVSRIIKVNGSVRVPNLRTQKSGQQADECHVGRIIIVEELAKPLAAASLSVVQ